MQAEEQTPARTSILRRILETLLYLAIAVAGVLIFGWLRGWNSAVQWSDGFFMAALISGFIAVASRMTLAFSAVRRRKMKSIEDRQQAMLDLRTAEAFAIKLLVVAGICLVLAVVISQ